MILFSCCLTRTYFLVICDASIILDGILGIQNKIALILSLTEGTDFVSDSIYDDVWEAEDEITGALSKEVESWDLLNL